MNPAILVILALVILAAFRSRSGAQSAGTGENTGGAVIRPTEGYIAAILEGLRDRYGIDIARNVERIYRLETANFDSGLFHATNAAGMRATSPTWPFGWPKRFTNAQMFAPVVTMAENAGGPPVQWVAFIDFADAARYLAEFLKAHGNNAGRWNSTTPSKQAAYNAAIANVPTPIVG